MEEYHKINSIFKRDLDAPNKPMIRGNWTTPELEYLALNQWEFTEKVDGTNIRVDFAGLGLGVEFGGRTGNALIPTKLLKHLQEKFQPENFYEAELPALTLYGEGYGPGIQKGGVYREDQAFVLFDVRIDEWWLERNNVEDIANKLDIDYVPQIGRGTLYDAIDIVESGLKSEWGNFEAEGIVARSEVQLFNRKGERIITKIKRRDFK